MFSLDFIFDNYASLGLVTALLLAIFLDVLPVYPLIVTITLHESVYGFNSTVLVILISTFAGSTIFYYFYRLTYKKFFRNNKKINSFRRWAKTHNLATHVLVCGLPMQPTYLIQIAVVTLDVSLIKFIFMRITSKFLLCIIYFYIYFTFKDYLKNDDSTFYIALFFTLISILAYTSKLIKKQFKEKK